MPTLNDAYELMTSHVKNENLRKHMLSVEVAMRFYARKYGEDEELWAMTGLLHDCDYEEYPDLREHTQVLAGWMRILSASFVEQFPLRILNLHPALIPDDGTGNIFTTQNGSTIPVFRGLHVVKMALDAGVKVTGSTVHYVTPEVDEDEPLFRAADVAQREAFGGENRPLDARPAHRREHRVGRAKANEIAVYLEQQNRARQGIERKILDQAVSQITEGGWDADGKCAIVLGDETWHAGVIGIVASRLVDRYHRPAVMVFVRVAREQPVRDRRDECDHETAAPVVRRRPRPRRMVDHRDGPRKVLVFRVRA